MKNEEKRLEEIKTKMKKEPKYISSKTLPDGTIIEMLLDKEENETSFAIWNNDKFVIQKKFTQEKETLRPYPASRDFLTHDLILFPSYPVEFENQQILLKEIQSYIHKYLAVSEFFEKICTYYVLFSWIYDDFKELPYLRGLGDYGTGKSRFLKIVGSICYHPIFTSGATTVSPIFRMLNDFQGTLVLDEADLKLSDTTIEMVKILNCGFAKGTPVARSEGNGKSFDVRVFHVYGPKIIGSRKLFDDSALESRMITEDMNQNAPRNDIPFNIPEEFDKEALDLRNKLLMFRFINKGNFKLKTQYEDRNIEPRLNQIAVPLMSIIDDKEIVREIQDHIRDYNDSIKADRTLSYNYQILDALVCLLNKGYEEPTIGDITTQFNNELEHSEEITSRKMGYLLKKTLNLKTQKTRDGYVVLKENKHKISLLAKRLGIELIADTVNDVNDVNVEENATQEKFFK